MRLKKRALIFSALGHDSGCALRARYFCEALRRLGWHAELALPGPRNLPFSLEAFLSIPGFSLRAIFSKADLVVGFKPYPNCWSALFLARIKGAIAVMDVDDLDSSWRGALAGKIASYIQAPAFLLLDQFSTHHSGIAAKLAGKGRVHELAQGVETRIFRPGKELEGKWLVFTAHLNIACQLELLINCVSPWLKRHPDWRLAVAGGGPMLTRFKARHQSAQVFFTGPLSPEEVALWIQRARVCLSVYDASEGNQFRVPMKCGEYLALKKPVITNFIPGLASLKNFLYLSAADSSGFGKQLDRLVTRRGDGREKKGFDWVRRHLSSDQAAKNFIRSL